MAVGCSAPEGPAGALRPADADAQSPAGGAALSSSQWFDSVTYIKASNPGVDDQFGGGGRGVSGEPADNSIRDAGAVYVYH